jgi:2-dehydro-3-deoxygluconokinase
MALLVGEPGLGLELSERFRLSTAGADTNVAVGFCRLGHRARWLGRVGADALGENVLRRLRADGVDVSGVHRDDGAPTGMMVRDSHPGRAIQVGYYRAGSAASRWSPDDIADNALDGVDLVHLTGITAVLSDRSEAATARLLELAGQEGVPVSVDPNIRLRVAPIERWRAIVTPMLERVQIVLSGSDELEQLGTSAAALRAAGVPTVVVKNDDKSATAYTADETVTQVPFPVTVVDAVGAGDAFNTGFLSARVEGESVADALHRGALIASLVVQAVGDTEGLPWRPELEHALRSHAGGHVHR